MGEVERGYDHAFFLYTTESALRSARRLLPPIIATLAPRSVLDVGCAYGAWLSVWKEHGVEDVLGLDGDYVCISRLLINRGEFQPQDLAKPFQLNRKFDLVQSLEVAEHIPKRQARHFVESLVAHGDIVLFSAAPPGQGGHGHVNEQGYEYWRALFRDLGYDAVDQVRESVRSFGEVEPWYRYNTFLYVNRQRFDVLPEGIRAARVPDGETLADIAPPLYRLRKSIVRHCPVALMDQIARAKERLAWLTRGRGPGSQ